ncbi:MAG: T9SS type A sorting domain-containing protein [Bacteroidota bacterium]
MKINIELSFIALLFVGTSLNAQNGSLDITFDSDGQVATSIGTYNDVGYSVAIQNDGKILVAGYSDNGNVNGMNLDFALIRYNGDGSLDNTFDNDGKVTTPIGSGYDVGTSVVIQNDGKIVVAGYSDSDTSGALNLDFALIRYNIDGSLDNTFDNDGKVTTAIGIEEDRITSITLQGDGKILVAGYSYNGSFYEFAIVRYNTDGSLDTTFDIDGMLTTSFGGNSVSFSSAIQNDGKIVAAGYSYSGSSTDFALIRFNSDGSLDTNFDIDGKVTTPIGNTDGYGRSVVIQNDGKIVLAGYNVVGLKRNFALIRYNTDGSLDTNFDADGILTTSIGLKGDEAHAVAIQSDGKIVATGITTVGPRTEFALIRYNNNGSLDNNFDIDGILTTTISSSYDDARSIAIQNDGKIVVAGFSTIGTKYDVTIVRYDNTVTSTREEADKKYLTLNMYPNPFNSMGTISFNKTINQGELIIYNLLGEKIKTLENISGNSIQLNRDNLIKGLYFISLIEKDKVLATTKIVIAD